jgi:hypothetical protein
MNPRRPTWSTYADRHPRHAERDDEDADRRACVVLGVVAVVLGALLIAWLRIGAPVWLP